MHDGPDPSLPWIEPAAPGANRAARRRAARARAKAIAAAERAADFRADSEPEVEADVRIDLDLRAGAVVLLFPRPSAMQRLDIASARDLAFALRRGANALERFGRDVKAGRVRLRPTPEGAQEVPDAGAPPGLHA